MEQIESMQVTEKLGKKKQISNQASFMTLDSLVRKKGLSEFKYLQHREMYFVLTAILLSIFLSLI